MSALFLAIVFVLNFGISWFNAYSVGRSWADSKTIGGWPRFLTWCGAVMSACGFTWCYLVIIGMIASATDLLEPQYIRAFFEIGYVMIIVPVLGSGLAIWIDSLTTAWRQRDLKSIGIAGWNTFAQVHNTYEAARVIPTILGDLGDVFKGGDKDSKALLLVLLLVILSIGAGALTTAAIIVMTARNYAPRVTGGRVRGERALARQ